jgi:bifunctional UDP-N-acetylglucosamine pyrophosphorylase/glucosamine-1-phosphate N-acetyltransferase
VGVFVFMDIAVVLLAAGQGTRMKSAHPKVLHNLCGKAMVSYIAEAAAAIKPKAFVAVVSPGAAESVIAELPSKAKVAVQEVPLGTGHAVQTAEEALKGFTGTVLVLCGDTPLITGLTLKSLVKAHKDRQAAATVLTAKVDDPHGYGRIIRGNGGVKRIVEECDADPTESVIREVNTGTYCFDGAKLFAALHKIEPENAQKEHYLTDVIEVFFEDNDKVAAFQVEDSMETLGINSRAQLADAEMIMQARLNREHMTHGVTLIHPQLTYIDATVNIGRDTVIYPNSFLTGKTTVGEGCLIGPSCQIVDSRVGDNCEISFSVVREAKLAAGVKIGPFANVRPGSKIEANGKVGSFVEIKASELGKSSKVPHLSYIGDATIGDGVNVGAGTITCNFDGARKHRTVIGDNAFIGSDTILVAPVRVGKGAYTGAGSTITKDVPEDGLGIERSEQRNLERKPPGKKKD